MAHPLGQFCSALKLISVSQLGFNYEHCWIAKILPFSLYLQRCNWPSIKKPEKAHFKPLLKNLKYNPTLQKNSEFRWHPEKWHHLTCTCTCIYLCSVAKIAKQKLVLVWTQQCRVTSTSDMLLYNYKFVPAINVSDFCWGKPVKIRSL